MVYTCMTTANVCHMHPAIVAWHQIVTRAVGITMAHAPHVLQKMQHAQTVLILHAWPDIIKTAHRVIFAPKIQTVPRAAHKYHV